MEFPTFRLLQLRHLQEQKNDSASVTLQTRFHGLFAVADFGLATDYVSPLKPIAAVESCWIPRTEVDSILARRREYNPTARRKAMTPLQSFAQAITEARKVLRLTTALLHGSPSTRQSKRLTASLWLLCQK